MTALVQTRYGDPHDVLELATVERPEVDPDDVLIRVEATSVNTPDWAAVAGVPYVLRLQFGLRGPSTPVRGTDVAGVVTAVGHRVAEFAPGDHVMGSAWANKIGTRAGTFAEFTAAPADQLIHKPESVSFEHAAASVMSGLTALIALRDDGSVGAGTRVLINGASGGVGTLAVQIAKARGAEVTGICSSVNTDLVLALGADEVIDYTTRDVTTEDARYDVVLDNVLNHPPSAMARILRPEGVLIPNSVGNTGGLFAGLPRMGRAALLRFRGKNVKFSTCEVNRANLAELADLLDSGSVELVIDSVHPLAAGAEAVSRMLSHRARGKIVVVPTVAPGSAPSSRGRG